MTKTCARCGQPVDGYAQINDDWYCHPDDETKPDCYSLSQRTGEAISRFLDTLESMEPDAILQARIDVERAALRRRGGEGEVPW